MAAGSPPVAESNPHQNGRGNFFRNILLLGGSAAFSQLVMGAAIPVLTRIYDPASYGIWSILLSVAVFFSVVSCLRYELSIVLPKSDGNAASCYAVTLTTACCMTLIVALLTAVFGPGLLAYFDAENLNGWLWVIPSLVFVNGIFRANSFWAVRKERFAWLGHYRILVALLTVGVQILFGVLFDASPAGLIAGSIVGTAAGALLLVVLNWSRDGKQLSEGLRWAPMSEQAAEHVRFPKFVVPYSLAGESRRQSFVVLLGLFSNPAEVGYYFLAQRLCFLPPSLISASFNPVYFQRLAAAEVPSDVGGLVCVVVRGLFFLAVPFTVLIWVAAPMLFGLAFGENWREAGYYAVPIVCFSTVHVMTAWLDRTFDVLGRQRLALQLELGWSAISLSTLLLGFIFFDPLVAITLAYGAATLYQAIWLCIVFRIADFPMAALLRLLRDAMFVMPALFLGLVGLQHVAGELAGTAIYFVVALAGSGLVFLRLRASIHRLDATSEMNEEVAGHDESARS